MANPKLKHSTIQSCYNNTNTLECTSMDKHIKAPILISILAQTKKSVKWWTDFTYQFDSRIDRVKKSGGGRYKLANRTSSGTSNQSENFICSKRASCREPLGPIWWLTIVIILWSSDYKDCFSLQLQSQKGFVWYMEGIMAFWEKHGWWWWAQSNQWEDGMVTVHGSVDFEGGGHEMSHGVWLSCKNCSFFLKPNSKGFGKQLFSFEWGGE